MLDFLFNLKPYPYEAGWEPRKRMLINVILCLICGFCFGYVRYIEDLLYARGITLPTIHSLCVCIFLTGLFLPYTLYKHGKTNFGYMITKRSWIVLIYISFELVAYLSFAQSRGIGSYLALSLLQGMMPCLLLIATYFVLKARYTLFHYIGILASLIGVALLIGGNQIAGRNYVNSKEASTLAGAIILSIISPVFYTATYITLEASLRQYYLEEILGLYGLYGIASNLFYTGLMNPWENFDGFTAETTPLFILAVILRSTGTIGLFILAKSENSILSGLAYTTIEFFYIVVSNLYGSSPFRVSFILFYFILFYFILFYFIYTYIFIFIFIFI
ncbi:hypothetical protein K502DRAFT_263619 [Neoconidiobolus thromboides FSU 785]|nr:hypothetical protein K502DRAFT_263619 [Neoconidiobolus thromboides FSU 785]